VHEGVSHDALMATLQQDPAGLIRSTTLFDIYKPAAGAPNWQEGERSLAVRLELRDDEATLTDDRIEPRSLLEGTFRFRTLAEARRLASFLARACPQPGQTTLGLTELMINAVEHGNLGITYREKSALNESGSWKQEVERRLGLPEYADRFATVRLSRSGEDVAFTIADQGDGFDWHTYLEMSPERAFDSHGRGIAMSRMLSFASIEYSGSGSTVTALVRGPESADPLA